MKICKLAFLLALIWNNGIAKEPDKHALLIGVGVYQPDSQWPSISSVNDINLLKDVLLKKGFQKEKIIILINEEATKLGILQCIDDRLLSALQEGDLLYFHFSGHGQQLEDYNGDEVDGLDECIVPYDSPMHFTPNPVETIKLLTDDELAVALRKIRLKLGIKGHCFVSIDACHSGTGIRGKLQKARGTDVIITNRVQLEATNAKTLDEINRLTNETADFIEPKNQAPLVAFFGSSQQQLNYEYTDPSGTNYGSLSFALAKNLLQLSVESSYRYLFKAVSDEMATIAPFQNPQLEGNLDLVILNGAPSIMNESFHLTSTENEFNYKLNAGFLDGLTKGSIIGCRLAAKEGIFGDHLNEIRLELMDLHPTSSLLSSNIKIINSNLEKYNCYIIEKNLLPQVSNVDVQISDPVIQGQILEFIKGNTFLRVDSQQAKLLITYNKRIKKSAQIILENAYGYRLDSIELLPDRAIEVSLDKLLRVIKLYLRGEFIKNLNFSNEDLDLSFQMILHDGVNSQKNNNKKYKVITPDNSGIKKLKVGSQVSILIRNNGYKPAYFNMVDIQPDNKTNFVFPSGSYEPEDFRLLPKEELHIPIRFQIQKPLGMEIFKLIVTDKPIDFRKTYGGRTALPNSPLKFLLSEDAYSNYFEARAQNASAHDLGSLNIVTETFLIVE